MARSNLSLLHHPSLTLGSFAYAQIFIDPSTIGVSLSTLIARSAALPSPLGVNGSRLVVHLQIRQEAIDELIDLVAVLKEEALAKGWTPPPPTFKGMAERSPSVLNYASTPK
jgi:hypothetical protein